MTISQHLTNLIKFKTTHTEEVNGEFTQCVNYIKKHALNSAPNLFVTEMQFGKYPALILSTQENKQFNLILACHLDVVGAEAYQFDAEIKDNKLYGRGASDMKFAAAMYLDIIAKMKSELNKYNIGFIFTTEEETGGHQGTNAILDQGYKANVAFLPDGGDNWQLETEAKGFHFLKLKSKGQFAHGSRPWKGKNAIENLVNCLHAIKALFPEHGGERDWIDTMNIGTINGGISTNTVPESAEATINTRYINFENQKQALNKIQQICDVFSIQLKIELDEPPHLENKDNQYLQSWKKLAEKANGKVDYIRSFGGSDARFFTAHQIPCLVTKPKAGDHHTKNEWVDLKDLDTFEQVTIEFIRENG